MNKKFSTLLASVLLAGAWTTANADVVKVTPAIGGTYAIGTGDVADNMTVLGASDFNLTSGAVSSAVKFVLEQVADKDGVFYVKEVTDKKYLCVGTDATDNWLSWDANGTKIEFQIKGGQIVNAKNSNDGFKDESPLYSTSAGVLRLVYQANDEIPTDAKSLVYVIYNDDVTVNTNEKLALQSSAAANEYYVIAVDKDKWLSMKDGKAVITTATPTVATIEEANNYLWKISTGKAADGVTTTYTFTNKATDTKAIFNGLNVFTVNGSAASFTLQAGEDSYIKDDGSFDEDPTSAAVFGVYKSPVLSYTKKILNDLLADGFNMTIKRTASDKEVAKGVDVFGGKLKAVATADNATRFQLMNEDGDYIVLSKAAKWTTGNIGVDHRGYKFAIVSAEDLENDKDGNYLSWFEFDYYAGNTKSEVIEAKVFDGAGATAERFGSLFIQTLNKEIVLTVSETISASAESWAYITLVADNIVDPADLLTKAQFYRITKLAKGTEKAKLFAVLSCEKENNVGWIESVGNDLEAQWAVTVVGSNYVLKNRENPTYEKTVSINALREDDDLEDNIYVYNGNEIKIEAVPTAYTDGFYHLSKIKDERYKIGYHSDLFEGNAWINADKNGALELNREDYVELVATNVDSVKIENTLGYYKDGEYKTSTVKSLRFPFYTFKTVAGKNFGLDGKEYSWAAKTASKLAIRKDGEYYNLVIVDGEKKEVLGKVYAGASPADGILREQGCLYDKTVNDLFAVDFSNRPEYRRLGATIENDGFTGKVDTAKFFRTNEVTNYYLFENSANLNTQGGERSLNFLGESHLSDLPKNAALPFLVDTAYVRNNTRKPLYLLAVRDQAWVEGEKEAPCTYSHDHMTDEGEITTDASKCFHRTKATPGYRKADYLVVLADSAKEVAEYKGRTRLAFVPATHFENDMLVIESSKYTGNKKEAKNDTIFLADDKNIQSESVATFAFRLVNPADATEGGEGDFIIETNTKNEKGELVTAFVGVLNTVPVLVNDAEDAAPFNVEKTSEKATANESIAASEVTVIAGEGNVTIAGATGKKVVISNILGQVVANTVIASDNATIAAPAGVVVVAVEGEAAVKAIVK